MAQGGYGRGGAVQERTEGGEAGADDGDADVDCRPQFGLWESDVLAAGFVAQHHANKSCDDDTFAFVRGGDMGRGRTYKPPSKKMPATKIFCCRGIHSFTTMPMGRTRITVSMTSSVAPMPIQKMLKSRQYPPADEPTQNRLKGIQLTMATIVPTNHQRTTTPPTTIDWRRNFSTEKTRRYMRRMETLMDVTTVKYRTATVKDSLR